MKKTTTKNLNKKIASYGTLALAVAGLNQSFGQIQYTDIDPDEFLSGTRFLLDLNGDGTTDYEISNDGAFSGATPGTTARVYTSNYSSILGLNAGGNYNYPFALSAGATIDENQSTWITDPNYQTLNWQGCAYTNSQWCDGQVDKYLGLRINVGSDVHYGWVRMDVPDDASFIIVKDYALNLTPNEGIVAGDQGLGTNDNSLFDLSHFIDANNQLNLKSTNVIDFVEVYSISGQKVASQEIANVNGIIDLSNVTQGVYLVSVSIEGQKKSFKIVR